MSEIENENAGTEGEDFDLDEMFNNFRTEDKEKPSLQDEPVEKPKKPQEKKKEPVEEDNEAGREDDEEEIKAPKKDFKEKEVDYKAELEKLQKTVRDTQRSFHEDRKKLSAYKKAVEKLKEEGTLLDDEANALLDHTKYDSEAEDVPLLNRYFDIWDKEIENIRTYNESYASNDLEQHIKAFQHFIRNGDPEEVKETLADLSKFEDNKVVFTNQMLKIGRQYNDDIYSDIHEAGGIRNLRERFIKKEKELKNDIDNLKKQVDNLKKKHEDYDTDPPKRFTGAVSNGEIDDNAPADIKDILGR